MQDCESDIKWRHLDGKASTYVLHDVETDEIVYDFALSAELRDEAGRWQSSGLVFAHGACIYDVQQGTCLLLVRDAAARYVLATGTRCCS